ncbi:MAG: tRNA lysidine(34) synthetase TilS, partial [Sphingomonadaceae bacterium]|nr:tRNA lysidine(34) synthetase TilS [Sphingomonadaceae bacterium]
FENVEIVSRIFEKLGKSARKSDVATLVERLERGENASLAGLLACEVGTGEGESRRARRWRLTPEPPRKNS